jgi:hypothetical protein
MQPPTRPREKRYGWLRLYTDMPDHPKWRHVEALACVPLSEVIAFVVKLLCMAAKARQRGYVGDFEFDECAISLKIPPEHVLAIWRALNDVGWIEQDYIVDWPDRQPDHEDPTAAERQRQRRARQRARHAVAAGVATHEQFQILSTEERAAMERLAELDRVRRAAIEAQRQEPPLPLPLTAVKGGRVA